jgi:O-antigen/teichoic acid export membrane protein
MAAVAILSNIILIPLLGMIGAALASTLVAVGTNLWYMREVRSALHTHPFHRGYAGLLLPILASFSCVLVFRIGLHRFQPQWALILLALVSAYLVFVITALACGMETEEREIAGAAWLRIRGMIFRTVNA